MNNSPRGYALLMSVFVVSTILLTLAILAARGLTSSLQSDTGARQQIVAKQLAEGCMEAALLKLKIDNAYAGNETQTINGQTCTIRPIQFSTTTTVETEATVSGYPSRLRVVINDLLTFDVASWERVASF